MRHPAYAVRLPYLVMAVATLIAWGFTASGASADEPCPLETDAQRLGQVEATADIMPNLLKRSGSLRYESERMLKEAAEIVKSEQPPAACLNACDRKPIAEVVFSSNPLQVKSQYSESETCAEKAERSNEQPFVVTDRSFDSIGEAASWIESFTQGKGKEGEQLYAECSGGCSPRYTFFITPLEETITLDARVRCGHARDRQDNRYLLSADYRWICPRNG